LVEHVTENHGVGGSIPPLGTTAGAADNCRQNGMAGWPLRNIGPDAAALALTFFIAQGGNLA
jgi:hypothetical protein